MFIQKKNKETKFLN